MTFLIVIELLALPCLYALWRSADHLLFKLLWSVGLFLPVLGPAAYMATRTLPERDESASATGGLPQGWSL